MKIAQEDIVPVSSFPGIPSGFVVSTYLINAASLSALRHSSPLKYENK
jgi:hypothetical protein